MHRATLAAASILAALGALGSGLAAAATLPIRTLGVRADLVSGGEALVAIGGARDRLPGARVTLDGRNITRAFAHRPDGLFEGLVTGIRNSHNRLRTTVRGGRSAELIITGHPRGGPVFAGPEIEPWQCPDCGQAPRYDYFYWPAGVPVTDEEGSQQGSPTRFRPYDPAHPPPAADIATTTTTGGAKVPLIVRRETGWIDRDQYAIAVLFRPGASWAPWAPQHAWNHRMVITHGASCDTQYRSGMAPNVLDSRLLGAGFLVMSNALDNSGHNCNLVTQAESLLMTKQHVVDRYGPVRWTIGSGCSGGSLAQQQVANAYPGIYDGLTPQCSLTDAWSSLIEYYDYRFALRYFENPLGWEAGTVWTPPEMSAVLDHPDAANAVLFLNRLPDPGNPARPCAGVPANRGYNPLTNRYGVRCTLQDYMANVLGRRAADGFANRPVDDVGVQYGLRALRADSISAAEFVDLNARIGGADIDGQPTAARTSADLPGLRRAYRSGAIDEANNLDRVAIIDLRGPDPGFFHDVYRTYALRARLVRDFGTAANQVLWRGEAPIVGDPAFADQAIFAMDRWLARVHADRRPLPLARKIISDRPGDVAARCTDGSGNDQPAAVCDRTVTAYGTPRLAAGGPATDDVWKCRTVPLRRNAYPVTFTARQWARLQAAFPTGVCDWRRSGVGQQPTVAWLTYGDGRRAIPGGRRLGPAPRAHALRR